MVLGGFERVSIHEFWILLAAVAREGVDGPASLAIKGIDQVHVLYRHVLVEAAGALLLHDEGHLHGAATGLSCQANGFDGLHLGHATHGLDILGDDLIGTHCLGHEGRRRDDGQDDEVEQMSGHETSV